MAERAGLRPRYRHLANSAATLTRPDTHFDLVRPGIAVYGLSPVAGRDVRAAAGDDRAGPGDADQAGAGRHRRLLRAHLHHRDARRTLAVVPLGLRRRGAPARVQHRAGAARRRAAGPSPAGSAWTSSCSTAATTRWPPATWRRCSAAATTASPPPTTGPRRSARSTTRSSPGSAAPGCPRVYDGERLMSVTAVPACPGQDRAPAGSAGLVGAAVGVAAAGAGGRRRGRTGPGPPAQGRPGRPVRATRRSASSGTTRRTGWSCRTAPTSTSRWSSRPARCPGIRRWCWCTASAWTWGRSTSSGKMLAARGDYRIVAYDQPGHGRSGRLETGEYDLAVLGRTLRRGDRPDRPGRAAGAGRALDGRHDHHGVRRAVPGAVR